MRYFIAVIALAVFGSAAEVRVPKWTRFEHSFQSAAKYENPLAAELTVTFRSPSGASRTVPGFWDGGGIWRVRFSPNEEGRWTFETSFPGDTALHGRRGSFMCTRARKGNRFEEHGPVRLSPDRRRLVHHDGTPFFWLADTAWNGPLFSTAEDWKYYVSSRAAQGFTAVQWVTTQWRGAPEGDASNTPAYTGTEKIRVNPEFFRRLDEKSAAITRAGMLSVPVMLWAISSPANSQVNPGVSLPDDQAILLARYMLARWGADPVVWFLNGDGDYRGERAEKWKRIGRGVFGDIWHAPVSVHPGGRMWVMDEFRDEPWLDIAGYQSAHGDSDGNSAWITVGPPAQEWKRTPARPVMSIEAPYEVPGNDAFVRRNHLWSLLNAPIAGITYGAHAIWSWSDGVKPPAGHGARVHPHWKAMVDAPAARQMCRLRKFFEKLDWTALEPDQSMLTEQPGAVSAAKFVPVVRSASTVLAYVPAGAGTVTFKTGVLPATAKATWIKADDPGACLPAAAPFAPPNSGDWLLLMEVSERAKRR